MANEKRLIDANALSRRVFDASYWDNQDEDVIWNLVQDAPTVDAVEVVRCKDCKHYEQKYPGYGYCYHWDYEEGMSPNEVEDDDFCSYGERKTE